jgi:hypothetical protein
VAEDEGVEPANTKTLSAQVAEKEVIMLVLRRKAIRSFLYFVYFGALGFSKISSDVRDAYQFSSHGDAEDALSRVAQSFDVIEP